MRSWWSFSAEPPAGADEAVLRRFVEVSRRGEITAIANSASSEEELGELVPNELCEAYEAEIGFVVVARGGARRCEVVGSIGLTDEERGKLRDDPLCAEALTAERPTRHIGEDLLGVGARSVALAPFVTPRRDRVVVGAARLYERGFDDGELALLSAAAETVGHALERAWAHAELEARTRQQESAAELGVRALNEPSLDALMREAVTQVGRTLEVEYAAITELLPDGKAVLRAALGFPGDLAAEDVLESAPVFGGRALDEAAVGARRGDGRSNLAPALVERGIESAVSAVITGVGRPFGVVAAYSKSARDFGENDRLFLRSVANVLAAAVRRSRAEAALRTGEERLELALRAGRMAAWEWDVRTGVVRWSRGLEESLGLGPGSVAEMYEDFLQLVHADDRDSVRRAIREALERRGDYHSEFRVVPSDGHERWVEVKGRVVTDEHDEPASMLGVAMDVTERKRGDEARRRLEEQLRHQALHDALTGLPNRALMSDRLRQALSAAQRERNFVSLLLVDLDRFKEINDTLGHETGDEVLRQIAARVRRRLRDADTLARLGGDEFAVILPDVRGVEAVKGVARKVLDALEEPLEVGGVALSLRASVGVALFPLHGDDAESLHRCADAAMYRAKRLGGGYALYAPSEDRGRMHSLRFAAQLGQAIDRDQLTLLYQPAADLHTGRVVAVEGLLRWRHPVRGEVPPDEFVRLAEQTGLIKPLSEWALVTAVRESEGWREDGERTPVAMKLSAQLLYDRDLIPLVRRAIEDADASARRLELEIPESAVVADPEGAAAAVAQLRAAGIDVAIGDFGSGYASLAYVKHVPVRSIKIHRSFVRGMATDERDASIVRSAVELAHRLGIAVVAEGVEHREAWRQLRDLGCDYVQGNYVAPPMPAATLATWLRSRKERLAELTHGERPAPRLA